MDAETKAVLSGQQRQIDSLTETTKEIQKTLASIAESLSTQAHHEFRIDAHDVEIGNLKKDVEMFKGYRWILILLTVFITAAVGSMGKLAVDMSDTATNNPPVTQSQLIDALKEVFGDSRPTT